MVDHVIDTNVLVVASAAHPDSPFKDSDVPDSQMAIVLAWLMAFWKDSRRNLVLDSQGKILKEYRGKLRKGRDIGLMVVAEKLLFARFHEIDYDANDVGCLPPELEMVVHDRNDRKLVAVALTDLAQGLQSSIINASDGDWYDWEKALKQADVVVEQLIEDWSRPQWEAKQKKKSKPKTGLRPARTRKKAT